MTLNPSYIFRIEAWLAIAAYSLFAFSISTISGVELAVLALYLLVAAHRLRTRPMEILPAWVITPFILWVAVFILSTLVNPHPLASLDTLRHQYRILLPFLLLPALAKVDLERLLKFYLVCTCLIALYGIVQLYIGIDLFRPTGAKPLHGLSVAGSSTEYYRARGTFAGPDAFANQMMMISLLFLALYYSCKDKARYWWAAGATMAAAGLVASFGRSAWLGMFAGLLVLALRLPRRWALALIAAGLAVFSLTVLLVGSGWIERNAPWLARTAIVHRISTAKIDYAQSKVRLTLWRAGIEAIKENPWLGVGPENREKLLPYLENADPRIKKRIPMSSEGADLHNIYLQVAFELGLVGLAAYLSFWTAIFVWNVTWILRAKGAFPWETGILWGTSAALTGAVMDGFFHDPFFSGNTNATILMFMGLSLFVGLRIRVRLRAGPTGDDSSNGAQE